MSKTVEDKIKDILVDQIGAEVDEITASASLAHDLGMDSLDVVEFVMVVEETFGFEVPDDDIDVFEEKEDGPKFGEIVAYIEKKTASA